MRIQFKLDKSAPQGRKLKYTVIHCKGILAPIGQKYPIMVGGPSWSQRGKDKAEGGRRIISVPQKKQRTINSAFAACNGYQRSPSVPCTLVSIPDITHKKSKFYESLGFSDTRNFFMPRCFPRISAGFGARL